jgi:hypothetical protein
VYSTFLHELTFRYRLGRNQLQHHYRFFTGDPFVYGSDALGESRAFFGVCGPMPSQGNPKLSLTFEAVSPRKGRR